MIPPVPAPRYKRKLITNEDSKNTSNNQNTSVSEQTSTIMPPPRRKNKSLLLQETFLLFKEQENTAFLKKIEKDNRVKHMSNINALNEHRETISNQKLITCTENNVEKYLLTNDTLQKDIIEKNYVVSVENEKCHNKSDLEHIGVDNTLNLLDGIGCQELELSPIFGVPKNIFETFIENRVVDIPVRINDESIGSCEEEKLKSQCIVENDDREDNRVNSSLSENSATIVGVFYKPEYSLLNTVYNDRFVNEAINSSLNTTFGVCSGIDDGNKTADYVPIYDSNKINNKIVTKDSEENDSGVYFSDTKSPPHGGNILEITNKNIEEKSKPTNTENDLEFYKPFSCNVGDTFDNNSSEDIGPQNYRKMLDYFEAQTVNAFHEEIAGRFSLCNGEINKNKVVEDWLDNGEYLSKKKNSSLSAYLKNMLEMESSAGILSPYTLSVVDEDRRSDTFSDDLSESKNIKNVDRELVLEACTVPSSLTNSIENRIVAPSNNVDFIVDMNNVNKRNVNIDCIKVTPNNSKYINISDNFNDNDTDFNDFSQIPCFVNGASIESDFNVLDERSNDNYKTSFDKLLDLTKKGAAHKEIELCVQSSHHFAPSPTIQLGAVNSLIAYFENIRNQEEITNDSEDSEREVDAENLRDLENENDDEKDLAETPFSPVTSLHFEECPINTMNGENDDEKDLAETPFSPVTSLYFEECPINTMNGENENDDEKDLAETPFSPVTSLHFEECPINTMNGKNENDDFMNHQLKHEQLSYNKINIDKSLNYHSGNNLIHVDSSDQDLSGLLRIDDTNVDVINEENMDIFNSKTNLIKEINNISYEETIENCSFATPNSSLCHIKEYDTSFISNVTEEVPPLLTGPSQIETDESCDKELKTDLLTYSDFADCTVDNLYEIPNEEKQIDKNKIAFKGSALPLDSFQEEYCRSDKIGSENDNVSNLFSPIKDVMNINYKASDTSFKPTRIPVVILTEADVRSSPIGSIELHTTKNIYPDSDMSTDIFDESASSDNKITLPHLNYTGDRCDEPLLKNTIDVILEKNWGSVGLKIKGDEHGVTVSEVLAGGVADQSGLIFKGDRLVGVNGQCVRSPLEAEELLRTSADVVHLHLQRHGVSQSLPRHRQDLEHTDTMGSNMSRHSGKGLTGRRSQSSGNLCNGKVGTPGVARFFSPCSRGSGDSVGPRDRYKFCGSLPNHLDSKDPALEEVSEADDDSSYRNNNNIRHPKKSDVVLKLQPLVPGHGRTDSGVTHDQGYASERSPEDELPPDLPPPSTASQLTCPVHHPASKPVYPFLHKHSTFMVTLMKGTRGLGLSVTGGVDTEEPWPGLIRIKRLFPHQPAWQSGQLAQGDFLLVANNTSLIGLTNYEALEVLRTTPTEVVLTVCRPPPELQVLSTPLPAESAPIPPRRDPVSTSSLQLPLKRMDSFGEFELMLKKVNGSLGFTLRKEDESVLGHYVRALVREPALSDGRIKPGDKIVAVNGVDMSPMSHEEAVMFLRQCGQEVHLKLFRDPAQTPVQALSPTEHHRTFKPILRKEAQDMLSDLAVKKSMSPNESSGSSSLSNAGRTSSPRKRRLTKTPSPDHDKEKPLNHLLWSEEVLERVTPGCDGEKPRRPDSLNFTAERKPQFQFSALGHSKTEESLNSLDSLDCCGSLSGMNPELGVGPLPSEPVSMPPLLSSDSTIGFSYRNPAYRSANPAPSKSKSSLSEDLPDNRCSDNDLTGGISSEGSVEGSKGLLKWKGVVFTPEDGTETATSPEDSISQITEVDVSSNQVLVVELNRGWNSRLGFSLQQSGRSTLISAIHPDSVASRDGRLKAGDQLIMVNDESVEGMSTAEVINLLRRIRGSICITVWRKS